MVNILYYIRDGTPNFKTDVSSAKSNLEDYFANLLSDCDIQQHL